MSRQSNRHFNRKRIFTGLKIVVILMILNLSAIFLFGQTTGAETTSTAGSTGSDTADLSIAGKPVGDPEDILTGGIDYIPDTIGRPARKNSVDPPKEGLSKGSDPAGQLSAEPPVRDGNLPDKEGNSGNPDGLSDKGNDSGTDSESAPDQDPEDPEKEPVPFRPALQSEMDGIYHHEGGKVAYLTFDDGPTPDLTTAILDILKAEGVKATFFTIGSRAERYPEMIQKEYEEGHGIASHSFTHDFKHIYNNPENLLEEVMHSEKVLQSILGEDKEFKLIRFPGGSFGEKLAPYREAVNEAGYFYVDWNSLSGDAETRKPRTAKQLIARLKETVHGQSGLVVLMHDAPKKQSTVEALPEIIRYLKSEHYRFELIPGSR